ncbi:MAG: HlyD family efflux transporter periplasmic adaptor subunit [Chloroflexi bacterium]|nr:HlyD family efflux transporter periplasmic adaptor subunit [Chloroflexota bacterium]
MTVFHADLTPSPLSSQERGTRLPLPWQGGGQGGRFLGLALSFILLFLLAGCGGQVSPTPRPAVTPAPTAVHQPRSGAVSASAKIAPTQRAELSFPAAGRVQTVAVKEGDLVQAGAVLVSLEKAAAEAAVAQTQATLARAQAYLAELKAGPRPEELAAAQAAVDAAQAQLARVKEAARPEEIAAAEATLAAARAEMKKVQAGPDANVVAAAAADLANAQAALRQAQAAYDQIKGNTDAGRYPQALQLEQATNAVAAAQARYRQATQGPTAADLARGQAGVDQAVAGLAKVQAAARPADVAAAEAEVRRGQAQYDLLKAGARTETIAAAAADVAAAEAVLQHSRADLANTELRAPFAGTVAALKVNPGEMALPGQAALTLADLGHLWVETTDLSERDVARVALGRPATVFVEALGAQIPGRVARLAPQASVVAGDVVYTVVVELDNQPPGLRWGMSAEVEINAE